MVQRQTIVRRDHVRLEDARGVAVAQNGREIVGLVDAVHEHRQVGLPTGEDLSNALESFVSHLGIFSLPRMRIHPPRSQEAALPRRVRPLIVALLTFPLMAGD